MEGSQSKTRRKRKARAELAVIGWRETVTLPDLGLIEMHAKIDTGATTTALHASLIRTYDRDGALWVEFRPPRIGHERPDLCHAPVHDQREVRNTSGVPIRRIIIRTTLQIAGRSWLIDVSLADRTEMTFPVIIGRSAIRRHRLLVDCGRSYVTGHPDQPPPVTLRERNRP
ncbi:RimK/LysX family protein [Defluviimonas sp. D31]|uniref:ATP-dependent zinc protease family protein n=1 Tax=Defluviimonas sp. D31 TaxID=3083253 RepID=UPI00296E6470|nr:RimK/LysX family protein [Defluviimonas sp. D31]MDW4549273.1 RimK/LysX family protein [Defluviimonas sp. D31]